MSKKKKNTKKGKQQTIQEEPVREGMSSQTRREILGVCLIALAVFFGVSLYSDAVGIFGAFIKGVVFGLFGFAGYPVPVLMLVWGIVTIAKAKVRPRVSTTVFSVFGVLCLLVLFHAYFRNPTDGIAYGAYIKQAYISGSDKFIGGGFFGSLIAYPALKYLGAVGTWIFFIAGILVVVLALTRISIKEAGEKVKETIITNREAIQERRAARDELYTEDLYDDVADVPASSTRIHRSRDDRRSSGVLNLTVGSDDEPSPGTLKGSGAELSFLPESGSLEIRGKRAKPAPKPPKNMFDSPQCDVQEAPFEDDGDSDGELILGYEDSGTDIQGITADIPVVRDPMSRISCNAPEPEETVVPTKKTSKPVETPVEVVSEIPGMSAAQPEYEYQRPPFSLLRLPDPATAPSGESPIEKGKLLLETLASFNVQAKIINISVGPVITRYELQPAQGIRVNKITALADDLALALAAGRVRIEAPIPGKAAIGIEVPNGTTVPVLLREIIESPEFQAAKSKIAFALGKDIAGKIVWADLDKMPHLLIAGATGAGKSVCINSIVLSMIYKTAPDDLRMILIDPKVVELKVYSPMPHLLLPVVTEPKRAAGALKWAVMEMEQRYQKMAQCNAREITRYNALQTEPGEKLPKIVVVIDELADLMMVAAKDVEESICRIAQLGRAAGIHLIVATQRPSTDVITGLIKANIPSRIAFMVSSLVDSRVILDMGGAEKLIGKGDLLFHANGAGKPVRSQGAFVSDEEVENVMDFFASQGAQNDFTIDIIDAAAAASGDKETGVQQGNGKQEDELLPEAVRIVLESGSASISMIQRRLRVGYARAARLVDIMEQKKIVSGFDGSKPRKLLIDWAGYQSMFGGSIPPVQDAAPTIEEDE